MTACASGPPPRGSHVVACKFCGTKNPPPFKTPYSASETFDYWVVFFPKIEPLEYGINRDGDIEFQIITNSEIAPASLVGEEFSCWGCFQNAYPIPEWAKI